MPQKPKCLRENRKTQRIPLIAKAREGRPNVSPARQGWVSIPKMICLPRPDAGAP
jgi:hypothetical protein